jgi:uncharacterized protein (TIGR02996 family)
VSLRHRELEDAIARDPEPLGPWLVYADWLQERGDVRGALIPLGPALREQGDWKTGEPERALLEAHPEHLLGPAAPFDAYVHRGFVQHVRLWAHEPDDPRVLALLQADHPATRFLRSLSVLEQHIDRMRALLAEHGRSLLLLTPSLERRMADGFEGLLQTRQVEAGTEVSVELHLWPMSLGGHSVVASAWLEAPGGEGRHRWCHGNAEWGLQRPGSGLAHVSPFAGSGRMGVTLRLHYANGQQRGTLWLEGQGPVPADDRSAPFPLLPRREPCREPPFEISEPRRAQVRTGPVLRELPPRYYAPEDRASVIPEVGVFVPREGLLTEQGRVTPAQMGVPQGDFYRCLGGPGGALALSDGGSLWLLRWPGGEPREVELMDGKIRWAFDGAGRHLAVLLASRELRLRVFEVDSGREVWSASPPFYQDIESVVWFEDQVCLVSDGELLVASPDAEVRAYLLPRVTHGWHEVPIFEPARGRAAHMACVEFTDPSRNSPSGTSLVSWADCDGRHGSVAVPDEAWNGRPGPPFQGRSTYNPPLPYHTRSGRVVILPDGPIVAIGSRAWWIDTADGTATDLGPARANRPCVTTTAGGERRLWLDGPGPWWIELPPTPAPPEAPAPPR